MLTEMIQKKPRTIFKSPKQDGLIGIELELEGMFATINGDTTFPSAWHVKPEGSLRGGYEFITKKAGALKTIQEKVSILSRHFDTIGCRVNPNAYRGSTHIHVNVQEEPFHNVLGCLVLFTAIEPLFLRLCGPTRNGNLFCMSGYDTGDLFFYTKALIRAIRRGDFGTWPQRGKYASLNFETIVTFGSIEFRCFPTSINPEQISKWCHWCAAILDTVKTSKDRAFYDLLNRTLANPSGVAGHIFGKGDLAALAPKEIEDLIRMGCETAFEMAGVIAAEYEQEEREQPKKKPVLEDEGRAEDLRRHRDDMIAAERAHRDDRNERRRD